MTLTVVKYPKTELADGHECKFSNAYNSLYVDVIRQDYAITGSGANAGYLVLYVADASSFSLNQRVYYSGLNTASEVVKSGTALIWDKGATWIALLTTATNPTNQIVSGTINEISNTKREVEISGVVSDGTWEYGFTERRFSYNENGEVRIYLNNIVKSLFAKMYNIDETVHNEKLAGSYFYLSDVNCKDLETDTEIELLSEDYIAVKSIAQLGEDNRLVDYEVYNDAHGNSTAKFMTAFEKPVYFPGYPFTICAAIGEQSEATYYRHEHGGVTTDTLVNVSGKGIYKMKVQPVSTERDFNISLISGVYQYGLLIDDAGHELEIDGDGNTLRIQ